MFKFFLFFLGFIIGGFMGMLLMALCVISRERRSEHTNGKLIATLNTVYADGSFAEIIAIGVVKDEHEGEIWFGVNKTDDGTQVDYVLHQISEVAEYLVKIHEKAVC